MGSARQHLFKTLIKNLASPSEHASEAEQFGEELINKVERESAGADLDILDGDIKREAREAMTSGDFSITDPDETTAVNRLWERVSKKVPIDRIISHLKERYPKATKEMIGEVRAYIVTRLRLLFVRRLKKTHSTSPPPPQTPGKEDGDGSADS